MNNVEKNETRAGALIKRVMSYAILILVLLVSIKLLGGFFIGIFTTIFSIALVIALVFGVIWALRHL